MDAKLVKLVSEGHLTAEEAGVVQALRGAAANRALPPGFWQKVLQILQAILPILAGG